LRPSRTVGWIGGRPFDEFAVLLPQANPLAIQAIARRIIRVISMPYPLAVGQTVSIGASVGVALASASEAVDGFIKRADDALYEAKQAGKGVYRLSLPRALLPDACPAPRHVHAEPDYAQIAGSSWHRTGYRSLLQVPSGKAVKQALASRVGRTEMTRNTAFSLAHLRAHTDELVAAVHDSRDAIIITDLGVRKVVLQDIRSFESLQRAVGLLERLAHDHAKALSDRRAEIDAVLGELSGADRPL